MQHYIGTIIKNLRKEKQLTQKELAQDFCTVRQLSRIESNVSSPSAFILTSFSNKLGVDLLSYLPYACESFGYEIKNILDETYFLYNNHNFEEALLVIKQLTQNVNITDPKILQEILWLDSSIQLHSLKKYDEIIQTKFIELLKITKDFDTIDEIFKDPLTKIESEIISTMIYNLLVDGNYNSAKEYLLKLIQSAESSVTIESNASYLRSLINLSRIYYEEGNFGKAQQYSKIGIDYCHRNNNLYLLDMLSNLYGRALYKLGHVEKGQKFIIQYILLSQSRNSSSNLNSIYELLWSNYKLGEIDLTTLLDCEGESISE